MAEETYTKEQIEWIFDEIFKKINSMYSETANQSKGELGEVMKAYFTGEKVGYERAFYYINVIKEQFKTLQKPVE